MPALYRQCAVDLLCGNRQRQLVRQRDASKSDEPLRGAASCFTPAVGWADGKDQMLRPLCAGVRDEGGEIFRREKFAG